MIKKTLLLLSCLTICSCTNDFNSGTSLVNNGKVYQNVQYSFNDNRYYDVYTNDKNKYTCAFENVHYIYLDYYLKSNSGEILNNEFYTSPKRLYIYIKK